MKKNLKNSLCTMLVAGAFCLPLASASSTTIGLTGESIYDEVTLNWSGPTGISAYIIFENSVHIETVGSASSSVTLNDRPAGTKTYRVEGCISQGCAVLTSNNQAFSNNINLNVGNSISYQVRRHNSADALTNANVDTILLDGTSILNVSDGSDDVACNVSLNRQGNVTTFITGDGDIDSETEFNALDPGINLVNEINDCGGGINPNILGCGTVGGSNKIAVVPVDANIVDSLGA
ncbi:hypothetical protein L3081_23145 [Colwellia sp. MSW7]|uniref:Uncharacterized protein n=1 Tax=Colwellia maritima TaxID=2912588 RepID=A0ABS9X674_9GAMM|nr:hypothetical protein [Colwellia maritima]MCI2285743.1 hypothetical protein [Colwellia maritima]